MNAPLVLLIISLCCLTGLVIYANFAGCDPLSNPDRSERLTSPNQLVGYFVVSHLKSIPGMLGVFLAAIFSGSLSSVSSSLNSLASVIWHDILQNYDYFKNFNDIQSLAINKLLVLGIGVFCTGLTFVIATFGGNLIQISTSLNGAFASPTVGIFLLGMFTSVCTPRGVIIGAMSGFVSALWLNIGAYLYKPVNPILRMSTEFCPNVTLFTSSPAQKPLILARELKGFSKFYSLSMFLYMPFCLSVTILVGVVASLIDGGFRHEINRSNEYIYFDVCSIFTKLVHRCRRRRESVKRENVELNDRF